MQSVWFEQLHILVMLPGWLYGLAIVALWQITSTIWGYPAYLHWRAKRLTVPSITPPADSARPHVCVLISAHNEATCIQRRIRNLNEQSYPSKFMRVLVVCDGCSDNTAELAQAEGAEVLILPKHKGKSHALNSATDKLGDVEIIVFTDARPLFAPDAIEQLVAALQQPGTAAVSGVLNLNSPTQLSSPIGRYWQAETALRQRQALVNGTVGCSGPICACWRNFWHGIPSGVVLDDVWLALDVAAQGGRVAVCADAVATDDRDHNPDAEWQRKLRTSAGNWQLVFTPRFWPMLWRSGKFWHWCFHKLGRLMLSFSLAVLAAVMLLSSWQLFVAALVMTILATQSSKGRSIAQLTSLVLAPLAGLAIFLTGHVDGRWES